MTFLENVLAGIVVAVLLQAVCGARARWGRRRSIARPIPHSPLEPSAMDTTVSPADHDLFGAHRELSKLLQELRAEARMSYRELADEADFSSGAVHKVLKGPGLASEQITFRTANVLAVRAVRNRPGLSRDAQERALTDIDLRARRLWQRAGEEAAGPHPVELAVEDLWGQIRRGAGCYLPDSLPHAIWEAIGRSELLDVDYHSRDSNVWLYIATPDSEAYFDLEEEPWTEEFAHTLSRKVGKLLSVSSFCVEGFDESAATAATKP